MRGECGKFVGRRFEWQAGELRDTRGDLLGELGIGVEPGADGGSADRELVDVGENRLDTAQIIFELGDIAGKLLPERQRDRIHKMRPANLYDGLEFLGLRA